MPITLLCWSWNEFRASVVILWKKTVESNYGKLRCSAIRMAKLELDVYRPQTMGR